MQPASVEYYNYNGISSDGCTNYLKISRRTGRDALSSVFIASCPEPERQIFGSEMDERLCFDPNINLFLRAKERFEAENSGSPTAGWTTNISHALVVDAIVHCIDRATERITVHDPETDHKLWADAERLTKHRKPGCMSEESLEKAQEKVLEVREREERRRRLRKVEGEAKENEARDAEIDEMENSLD